MAGLLLTALTASGSREEKAETKPAAVKGSKKKVDCTDENLTQAEWMQSCSDEGGDASAGPEEAAGAGKDMTLGESAQTGGDEGTGVLHITPDTVVFTKKSTGATAKNGLFAVVVMKDKAMTAVAADEPAPVSGGGWQWRTPDGETIGFDSGNSSTVAFDKYDGADPVQPGSWQWRSQVFDLTPAQAKGGTLVYVDGDDQAHAWKMPATDSGPNVADVKAKLDF
ncbi:hypothetical protein ACFV9W_00865 [Streptomyces sp. NPDC059897]|uniref:hypothetical protein n=1 Tax=Streptomyces sp. NPDC059897 TaxID=3346994 RepID=UPI003652DC6B